MEVLLFYRASISKRPRTCSCREVLITSWLETRMEKKQAHADNQGQSYVGLGKILIWIVVVGTVFLLKLCGFDVQFPTVTP